MMWKSAAINQFYNEEPDWLTMMQEGSAGAMMVPHMRKDCGDKCGHIAKILNKTLGIFGYRADRGVWNLPGVLGHTYSVVKIQHDGREIWQHFDATYKCSLLSNGQPVDLREALATLAERRLDGLAMVCGPKSHRDILVDPSEMENVRQNQWFYRSGVQRGTGPNGELIFNVCEDMDDFLAKSPMAPNVRIALKDTYGLPDDPLYAMLRWAFVPTEIWDDVKAITGYEP